MKRLKSIYRFLHPRFQSVHLDYSVNPQPRYGHGLSGHDLLYKVINEQRTTYAELLHQFLKYKDTFKNIKDHSVEKDENQPTWNNDFLPGLDIVGIYGMLSHFKPSRYIEIGSGNSTKVARKAIKDQNLSTEIISIDPYPRANIDHLANQVIRQPFENLKENAFIYEQLEENDVLFIDNSHRVFPNSDAMIFFLEILPRLKKGVIVQIHDIYLPYDYPQFMCDRFYNEQYMLAAFLIANPDKYRPILPNYFISEDKELAQIVDPIWNQQGLPTIEKHGGSFWIQIS